MRELLFSWLRYCSSWVILLDLVGSTNSSPLALLIGTNPLTVETSPTTRTGSHKCHPCTGWTSTLAWSGPVVITDLERCCGAGPGRLRAYSRVQTLQRDRFVQIQPLQKTNEKNCVSPIKEKGSNGQAQKSECRWAIERRGYHKRLIVHELGHIAS